MERQTVALLFSDVAGYSKLSEPQLTIYLEKILPEIAQLLEREHVPCIEINTWGDGIVIASADPYRLAHFALDLRDFFRNRNWSNDLLPNLSSRIALHAGVVFTGDDPIRKTKGIIGTQVNLAARIEPITTPGEVWVTQAFVAMIRNSIDATMTFDNLGERPLAKAFGDELLFRLRRHYDPTIVPPPQPVQDIGSPPQPVPVDPNDEFERMCAHIINYLNRNKLEMVSFERIRERINSTYSDELLEAMIDRKYEKVRRATLADGRSAVGRVVGVA